MYGLVQGGGAAAHFSHCFQPAVGHGYELIAEIACVGIEII